VSAPSSRRCQTPTTARTQWQETPAYDTDAQTYIPVAPTAVRVNVPATAPFMRSYQRRDGARLSHLKASVFRKGGMLPFDMDPLLRLFNRSYFRSNPARFMRRFVVASTRSLS